MTRHGPLAALAALVLATPAPPDALANLLKGADTVPAIEKRLPASAGLPEFADARDSLVVTVRLVDVRDDGNDHGGFVRYEYTPNDFTPPMKLEKDGKTWRRANLKEMGEDAVDARLRFLRKYRQDCIPQGESEGPSGEGGYVMVLPAQVGPQPGCLMIEAGSRELVHLGRLRLDIAMAEEFRELSERVGKQHEEQVAADMRRLCEGGEGQKAGAEEVSQSLPPAPPTDPTPVGVYIAWAVVATGLLTLAGGWLWRARSAGRARGR